MVDKTGRLMVSIGSQDEALMRSVHAVLANDPKTGAWNEGGIDWELEIGIDNEDKPFYQVWCWVDGTDKLSRAYVELSVALQVAQMKGDVK